MSPTAVATKKRGKKTVDPTPDLFAANDAPLKPDAGGGKSPTGSAGPPMNGDDSIDMATFAERSYLTYAMSVVRGRAIPNVEDGQKPVQRRILHSMNERGLTPGVAH